MHLRIKFPYSDMILEVKNGNLDIPGILVLKQTGKNITHNLIENHDDITGEANHLIIQFLVMLINMITIYHKHHAITLF